MSQENNELPIILEDLPNFRLRKIEKDAQSEQSNQDNLTIIAKNFLIELQELLKPSDDTDSLYALYDYKFNLICQNNFKDQPWKSPEEIEEEFEEEGLEFETHQHYLYNELCYRHFFARVARPNVLYFKELKQSWDNYNEIFQVLQQSPKYLNLPCAWIWDIIDEFIYQFQLASKTRFQCSVESKQSDLGQLQKIIESNDEESEKFWNLEKVIQLLQENVEKSKIIQIINGEKTIKINQNQQMLSYLGYFSLIGLTRVHIYNSNYEESLKVIQLIDFESLFEYSKAVPSYLTLFYYVGFAYLMTKKYKEAVKIFEAIVLFFDKYKTFMTKSFQYDNMVKQSEKSLSLLVISLVFYPTQVEDSIMQILKDPSYNKQATQQKKQEKLWDKYDKICKFDVPVFQELFQYGSPKIIPLIQNYENLVNMSNTKVISKDFNMLLVEFDKAKTLNKITSILKLYTSIGLEKAAKILYLTEEELLEYLQIYRERNIKIIRQEVPFESTILNRFMNINIDLEFKMENRILSVKQLTAPKNYTKQFRNLNFKMIQLGQELNELVQND